MNGIILCFAAIKIMKKAKRKSRKIWVSLITSMSERERKRDWEWSWGFSFNFISVWYDFLCDFSLIKILEFSWNIPLCKRPKAFSNGISDVCYLRFSLWKITIIKITHEIWFKRKWMKKSIQNTFGSVMAAVCFVAEPKNV